MELEDALRAKARSLGLGQMQRHIFLCVGPDCCNQTEGLATWEYLKVRLKSHGKACSVYRSKAACLRLCMAGPIAVVYPEGIWYRSVTPAVCEQIIEQHLLGGRVVEEYVFAVNPLGEPIPGLAEGPLPSAEAAQPAQNPDSPG